MVDRPKSVREPLASVVCLLAATSTSLAACTDTAQPEETQPSFSLPGETPEGSGGEAAAGSAGMVAATPPGMGETGVGVMAPLAGGAALEGGGAAVASADAGAMGDGSAGAAGSGGELPVAAPCELPASFRWTSTQPLITPQPPQGRTFVSIKDPSIVFFEDKYHVFATVYETTAGAAGWRSVYFSFSDLAEANEAPQLYMGSLPTGHTVAPQVFYFEPHGLWYLVYQWGARYSTNPDINDPSGWSAPRPLLAGEPTNALDFWVICDEVNCHLFFSRDDGVLYRSKTPIESFPSFEGYEVVISEPSPGLLFEASNVYAVEGTGKYLLLVEAYGPRYFRSWTAESLDGPWTPLADTQQEPFAGAANVSFEGPRWTDDISHGEMLRSGFDQRLTISGCNLRYLYQGTAPGFSGQYDLVPYQLGLLTQQP